MSPSDDPHLKWAIKVLNTSGYQLKSNTPEIIQNTPWSEVSRFITNKGFVFLKQTPAALSLESKIIKILHEDFKANVPIIIAENAELNCFLMQDAGRPLREILKKQFDTALLCKAIDQFTSLQIAVGDYINIFLDIGVPDWRLDKLHDLYKQLLSQKDILIADGLSEIEIDELRALLPKVSLLCQKVSDYSIKQTLVQPDFNDNNTLIADRSQAITLIDLGEIVISHPFFSLLNGLHQIKKHHGITEESTMYQKILDACLNNYTPFESRENLLKVWVLIRPLWFVYGALAGFRLMAACGKSKILSFQQGKLADTLRALLIKE